MENWKAGWKPGRKPITPPREERRVFYKTEDDLPAGVDVCWRGQWYTTGNRYHSQVELYRHGEFFQCVCIPEVFSILAGVPERRTKQKGRAKRIHRRSKARIVDGALSIPESDLQEQCEQYLEARRIPYFHVPELIGRLCREKDRRLREHEKAILSAAFKGLPDLILLDRADMYELKVGKNRCDADQRDILERRYGEQWQAHVTRDVRELEAAINARG